MGFDCSEPLRIVFIFDDVESHFYPSRESQIWRGYVRVMEEDRFSAHVAGGALPCN